MELLTKANEKWIYTYDYAPDSVWEPWRDDVGESAWIDKEADDVAARVGQKPEETSDSINRLPTFILLADSHYTINGTWDDTVSAMRAVSERIRIDGMSLMLMPIGS